MTSPPKIRSFVVALTLLVVVSAQGQGRGQGQPDGLVIPQVIQTDDTPADFTDEPGNGNKNNNNGLRGPPFGEDPEEFERILIKFDPRNKGQAVAAVKAESRLITADLSDSRGIMGAIVRKGGHRESLRAMPFIDTVEDDFVMHTLGWEDTEKEDANSETTETLQMLAGVDDQDNNIVGLGDEAFSIHNEYKSKKKKGDTTEGGNDQRASFSQVNDQVEVAAPGKNVLSTVHRSESSPYKTYSGTSMACPHAAAVAGMVWSHYPDCTNHEIRNALARSAVHPQNPTDPTVCDTSYGHGTVKAKAMFDLLQAGCASPLEVATKLTLPMLLL